MHPKTKESAVKRYNTLQSEGKTEAEIKEAITADAKAFSEDDVNEIYQAIANYKGAHDFTGNAAKKVPPTAKVAAYPLYDLWRMDVSIRPREDKDPTVATFTAIKRLRTDVKLEKHVADSLNGQSHNNRRRYYPAGTVTNGDEEIITVK